MTRVLSAIVLLFICLAFKKQEKNTPYKFPELRFFPRMPISEVNPVTIAGVDLGRHLFYDPILSRDSNLSCSSCHRQESAFSDGPNKFSKARNKAAALQRNTLPLFNLAWYPSLFWDGRAANVEQQVFHPVRAQNEMNLQWQVAMQRISNSSFYRRKFKAAFGETTIDSSLIAKAIAQFERTLISYRSKYDRVLQGKSFFTKDELEGFELVNDMTKGDCLHCHTTDSDPLGTTLVFSNNGLDGISNPNDFKDKGRGVVTGKMEDNGKFKIPSLRNLAFTAPYMHDGRFNTLEAVLDFYSEGVNPSVNIDSKMGFAHQKGAHLTKDEKRKIIAFLNTLNDSAFVSDPAFSNPLIRK